MWVCMHATVQRSDLNLWADSSNADAKPAADERSRVKIYALR